MAGKSRIELDFNKIYKSNSCGEFRIIENMGRDARSRLFIKIKFLSTGTEKVVRYDIAMDGKVDDELYGIDFNKVYNSLYYGPYKIIEYTGRGYESRKTVKVQFLNTGYSYNVLLKQALKGDVKDKTVSFQNMSMSTSDPFEYHNYICRILKGRWKAMMDRCYNPNNKRYQHYGQIGVTVDPYWHDFENFLKTIPCVYGYEKFYNNPEKYQLDKDYFQNHIPKEKRTYSIYNCIFLSVTDNANLAILEKHDFNEFYGVRKINNKYHVLFSVNGERKTYGVYNDPIAAANEYNYYYKMYSDYELVPLFNFNVPYMSHEEAQQYLANIK